MIKIARFLLFIILVAPQSVLAKVNVEISGNLDGSSNQVNVDSNQTQTDIVINSSGEKKEYHGTGNRKIELKSGDGKSKVSVNNNSTASASPEATVSGVFKDNTQNQHQSFWELLKKELATFFALFR